MALSGGCSIPVGVMLLTPSARLPVMSSPFSLGFDLYPSQPATIDPFDRCLISTGLALEIPVSVSQGSVLNPSDDIILVGVYGGRIPKIFSGPVFRRHPELISS